jgi:hypothetical protein
MTTHEQNMQRDPEDTLDRVLRAELLQQAPPDLTARLLNLVPGAQPVVAPAPRPQRWYTTLVSVLTVLAVLVSLAVAWQFYGLLSTELGLVAFWQHVQALPLAGLEWLYAQVPAMSTVVDLLGGVRDQLHWLLAALVLWLALDGWSPRAELRQQQASG